MSNYSITVTGDKNEIVEIIRSADYKLVLLHLHQEIRNKVKYENAEHWNEFRDLFITTLNEYNIDLFS